MHSNSFVLGLIGAITLASSVLGTDEPGTAQFPLYDGFPDYAPPGSDNETDIYKRAYGTRPGSPLPTNLSDDAITSLQLISYTGIFEVAYFFQLEYNVTNNVSGYEIQNADTRSLMLQTLRAITAQEETHVLQSNLLLEQNDRKRIEPCKYITPVTDLNGAIQFADLFTSLLLGALQEILYTLGIKKDNELIRAVASILGNEGQQTGYFREYNHKIPSPTPFLTGASRAMAFNGVRQQVIVPNSCPNSDFGYPIFEPLYLEQNPNLSRNDNQTLQFYIKGNNTNVLSDKNIVYIYQQNLPVLVPISDSHVDNGYIYFLANYPTGLTTFGQKGLILALLVNSTQQFPDVVAVDPYVTHGPFLISGN